MKLTELDSGLVGQSSDSTDLQESELESQFSQLVPPLDVDNLLLLKILGTIVERNARWSTIIIVEQ